MEIRFAIPILDGILATHFHRSRQASIVDVKDNQIEQVTCLDIPSLDPEEIAKWFQTMKVDVLIAGGIKQEILSAINQTGVNVRTGSEGDTAEGLVEKFLNRTLKTRTLAKDPEQPL